VDPAGHKADLLEPMQTQQGSHGLRAHALCPLVAPSPALSPCAPSQPPVPCFPSRASRPVLPVPCFPSRAYRPVLTVVGFLSWASRHAHPGPAPCKASPRGVQWAYWNTLPLSPCSPSSTPTTST